ncbi:MAG TPA: tetratricopeptide repeat-containing glycosyltransferase family protein, partial [Rhodopila sp.]
AIELAPARSQSWIALGSALQTLDQIDDAAAATCQAISLDPDSAPNHLQLGDIRHRQRDHAAAETCYRRAIQLAPALPEAHCHLSNALLALLRHAEAEACYRAAIRLQPMSAAHHSNLGTALSAQQNVQEALAAQRQALAIDPDFIDARYNHAITLLLAGELEPGWQYYEARWQLPWNPPRDIAQPRWNGEPLAGRTILLHAEQGLGDMLQMARYVPLVAARGGRVVLQVHPPLVRLLQGLRGVQQVVPLEAPLPPFDLHCPLFSLPLVFRTRLDTIPAEPYLKADSTLAVPAACRALLAARTGLRVGLVWQGTAQIGAHVNRERSLALEQLAPLADIPSVALYSLQKDPDPASMDKAAALGITDLMADVTDFADTAARVAALDLVISVDTSTAHLAAAMGKPVWLLSRFGGCWRWLTDRSDSPWYPTLRLYRQDASRDWTCVMAQVVRDLTHHAAGRPVGHSAIVRG